MPELTESKVELLTSQINDHARLMERSNMALASIDERTRRHDILLQGDGTNHGLVMKVDRLEQAVVFVKWVGTGGLLGLSGTIVLLWQILKALAEAR